MATEAEKHSGADLSFQLREAQGALGAILHLSMLIRAAAEEIADTCYADRDDVLRALSDGAAIREAVEMVREKAELALDRLQKCRLA